MANFDYGSQCMVIASGRIGVVSDKDRSTVTLCFYDKDYSKAERATFKKKELKVVDDRAVRASRVVQFIKGKLSYEDLTEGTNLLPPIVDNEPKAYKVTVKDLLAGLDAYEDKPFVEKCKWVETVLQYEDEVSFPDDPWKDIKDKVTEEDILDLAWSFLDDFRCSYDYNEEEAQDDYDELKKELTVWRRPVFSSSSSIQIPPLQEPYDIHSRPSSS